MKNCVRYKDVQMCKQKPLSVSLDNITLHKTVKNNIKKDSSYMSQQIIQYEKQNTAERVNILSNTTPIITNDNKIQLKSPLSSSNNNQVSTYLLELKQISNLLTKFNCSQCKSIVVMKNATTIGHKCIVDVQCTICPFQFKWHSADMNINKQYIQAGLLSGIDYAEYKRHTPLVGMKTMSKQQFNVHSNNLWSCATNVYETIRIITTRNHLSLLYRAQLCGWKQLFEKKYHGNKKNMDDFITKITSCIRSYIQKPNVVDIGIILDFRWSQRRNALNGTLTIRTFSDFLLCRVNVNRTISESGTTNSRNFIGAAKNMEGAAVKEFLDEIEKYNNLEESDIKISIAAYVHDQDGCTARLINSSFTNSVEYLDVGHSAKNLKKRVSIQAPGYGEKACIAFLKCVKAFPNSLDRSYAIRAYPYHFANDHRFCIGGCPHSKHKNSKELLAVLLPQEKNELEGFDNDDNKKLENVQQSDESQTIDPNVPDTQETVGENITGTAFDEPETKESVEKSKLKILKKIFNEYASRANKYKYGVHTQSIEAGNNSMTILTNKRKFYRESYNGRVDTSLIRLDHGEAALGLIMKIAGNHLSDYTTKQLELLDTAKKSDKVRKESLSIKQRRIDDKRRKSNYAKSKNVSHPDLTYKGDSSSTGKVRKQRCCSNCKKPGHTIAKCQHPLNKQISAKKTDKNNKQNSKDNCGRKTKKHPTIFESPSKKKK